MPLLTWDNTDRLTDASFKDNDWPRLSDYTQLRDALLAMDNWFTQDHSGTTGRHLTTYGIGDFEGMSLSTGTDTVSATGNLGGIEWVDTTALSEYWAMVHKSIGASGSGKLELLYAGSGAFNNASYTFGYAWGYRRLTTGSATTVNRNVYTVPFRDDATAHQVYAHRKYRCETADVSRGGLGVLKSHYRQLWRLADSIDRSLKVEHNATTMVSDAPSPARLYGRVRVPATSCKAFTTAGGTVAVAAHGGAFYYLFPASRTFDTSNNLNTARWLFMPAYDDTKVYVFVQDVGYNHTANADLSLHGFIFKDSAPDVGTLPTLDTASYAVVANAIRPQELQKLRDGLVRYWTLLNVEHERESGTHLFPLDKLRSATKVYDSTITAPSAVADVTYSASDHNTGSSPASSYTDITTVTIETMPAGGGIYFPSLVGAAGSGIATVSIAIDDVSAYAIIRRVTTGTTNNFTLRVWRVDP